MNLKKWFWVGGVLALRRSVDFFHRLNPFKSMAIRQVFILIVLCLWTVPMWAQTTFGYAPTGANSVNFALISGSKFTVPGGCTSITKITIQIATVFSTSTWRAAIGNDSGGRPGTIIAQASADSTVTGTGPSDSAVTASITPGSVVWLFVWQNGDLQIQTARDTPGQSVDQSSLSTNGTYPTFPATPDDAFGAVDAVYSIVATCAATGGRAKVIGERVITR